jgi:hypothetical protein
MLDGYLVRTQINSSNYMTLSLVIHKDIWKDAYLATVKAWINPRQIDLKPCNPFPILFNKNQDRFPGIRI